MPPVHTLADGSGRSLLNAYRTVFVSDVHLGSPHCHAEEFLEFLTLISPQWLYLAGDFIDGRALAAKWRWPPVYSAILQQLEEMASAGTQVCYTPGNHDEFLRAPWWQQFKSLISPRVRIEDEFVHVTAAGQRVRVLHGDQFDHHECRRGAISRCTSVIYDHILRANRWLRPFQPQRNCVSAAVQRKVRPLREFGRNFRARATGYLAGTGDDILICGHIHAPMIEAQGSQAYCNVGDWVEHCSWMGELSDGTLVLQVARDWRLSVCQAPIQALYSPPTPPLSEPNPTLPRSRQRTQSMAVNH